MRFIQVTRTAGFAQAVVVHGDARACPHTKLPEEEPPRVAAVVAGRQHAIEPSKFHQIFEMHLLHGGMKLLLARLVCSFEELKKGYPDDASDTFLDAHCAKHKVTDANPSVLVTHVGGTQGAIPCKFQTSSYNPHP